MPSGSGHHHHHHQVTHEFHQQQPSPFMDDGSVFSITNPQLKQQLQQEQHQHIFPQHHPPNIIPITHQFSHHHQFQHHHPQVIFQPQPGRLHLHHQHQHHQQQQIPLEPGPGQGQVAHPFSSTLNFKLGLNESSGNKNTSSSDGGALNCTSGEQQAGGGGGGGGVALLRDVPESRPNSLIMPNSWQTQEDSAIKEPFWKPLDNELMKKRCNEIAPVDLEEEHEDDDDEHNDIDKRSYKYYSHSHQEPNHHEPTTTTHDNRSYKSLEEKYKFFGELEAIYSLTKIGGVGVGGGATTHETADQAGSWSALTGESSPSPSNVGLMTQLSNNVDATVGGWAGGGGAEAAINTAAPIGVDHGSSETSIRGAREEQEEKEEEEAASLRKIQKRKKKRKSKDQLGFVSSFFEGLVKQVMQHQEGLHRKFLEAIERMGRERTEREEAWMRQEAEKHNREAMDRAKYQALASSRAALIVSYMEKITGQSIELGLPTAASNTTNNAKLPEISKQSVKESTTEQPNKIDTNSRWPKDEVEALIGARTSLEPKFQEPGLKGRLWEEISDAMALMGYQRSAKRCKEKWENINKYFRKKKESGSAKKRSHQSKTCSYFDQLDQLYSRTDPIHGGANHNSSFPAVDGAQQEQRGGYSELLAFIVAQDPSSSTTGNFNNASEMESSKFDFDGTVDEKVEGSHKNDEDENGSEGEEEEEEEEVGHGN